MAARRTNNSPKEAIVTPITSRRPPATTPEGRENQMVALATDLAEQQLRDGTASAQVITHYLKQGTTTQQLEKEKLKNENLLLAARSDQIASTQRMEELYSEAIAAMRSYAGQPPKEDDSDYED